MKAKAKDGTWITLECLKITDGHGYVVVSSDGSIFATNNGFMMYCAENFSEKKAEEILSDIGDIEG
jgi:hypothetical protein